MAQAAARAVAGHAGDRAAARPLAAPPVQRHPPVLLSGRSGRDRDLADRGGPRPRTRGPAVRAAPAGGQRGGESRPRPAGAQARHRRRQDHRNGDADRLADHQRGAPSGQPPIHARLPGGHPGADHSRPAARAAAQRPGQLLPEPRAGAARPARRPAPGQDRHHQLPRLHAAGDAGHLARRPCPAAGPRPGAAHAGVRGADAAARHARPHGHEEHHGVQRRGTSLLPREAGRGQRRGQAQGRRPQGGREKQGSGAGMDLGTGGGTTQARPEPGARSVGHAVLPPWLRLPGGHAVSLDDERLLAHGRHRVRHRQAAPRAGGRQHPRRRHAQVP